ncbi:hypothetical protein SUGI_0769650 [Cryptomeria japonica]|nr:hypothetical protein SUGI_0769650 [Cryptomeria japonica]
MDGIGKRMDHTTSLRNRHHVTSIPRDVGAPFTGALCSTERSKTILTYRRMWIVFRQGSDYPPHKIARRTPVWGSVIHRWSFMGPTWSALCSSVDMTPHREDIFYGEDGAEKKISGYREDISDGDSAKKNKCRASMLRKVKSLRRWEYLDVIKEREGREAVADTRLKLRRAL